MTTWDGDPTLPPPTRWRLPDPSEADRHGVAGIGADLQPGTLLAAYSSGLFPMNIRRRVLGWWSPDPRGVIPLDGLRVSRSLRRSCQRFEISVDTRFREVMEACGDRRRPHGWITPAFVDAYTTLHELGWAHSVEVLTPAGELVGGVYGVRIGGFFAGESMFHRATDASKVALVALVSLMREHGMSLFDVQWTTPHLTSLGAVDVPRADYLGELHGATR
jgi:leucyl/phenylalanyl-tRNA--protein transferase